MDRAARFVPLHTFALVRYNVDLREPSLCNDKMARVNQGLRSCVFRTTHLGVNNMEFHSHGYLLNTCDSNTRIFAKLSVSGRSSSVKTTVLVRLKVCSEPIHSCCMSVFLQDYYLAQHGVAIIDDNAPVLLVEGNKYPIEVIEVAI